jgi:hypothetical protein
MSFAINSEKRIKEHFFEKMGVDLTLIRNGALDYLWHGPFSVSEMKENGVDNWPGYEKACEMLSSWADENIHDVWYNHMMDEILDNEPSEEKNDEGEVIPVLWDDYIKFDVRYIKRLVFRELINNGM